jgi:hypothetical protein
MSRTLFVLALVAFLATAQAAISGPSETRRRDLGKTRVEMPVPSRWVLVRGSKGDNPIAEGYVSFAEGGRVKIYWKIVRDGGTLSRISQRQYQLDPRSGLPAIGRLRPTALDLLDGECGTFRLVGRQLEFRLVGPEVDRKLSTPVGDLFFLLKLGD